MKIKFNPVREVIEGRSVVMVDDSLVRGTTSKGLVQMIRAAGAREVHLRLGSPPITGPCHYGIDTPTREELIAATHSIDEIRDYLGVDSLGYLSLDGMLAAAGGGPASATPASRATTPPPCPRDSCSSARVPPGRDARMTGTYHAAPRLLLRPGPRRRHRRHEGHPRRQGRRPRRDDQPRHSRPARLHHRQHPLPRLPRDPAVPAPPEARRWSRRCSGSRPPPAVFGDADRPAARLGALRRRRSRCPA